jgi:alginate O-acetyltransferase complex protein AlgI
MGGNRQHQVRNMFVVWGLTGLWHGASWNFILWGLYYFLLLFIEKKYFSAVLKRLPVFVGHLYTLFVVIIGWVFFYFTDFTQLTRMLLLMSGFSGQPAWNVQTGLLLQNNLLFFVIAAFAATPLATRLVTHLKATGRLITYRPALSIVTVAVNILLLFASTAALVGSTYNPFLYFRF